MEYNGNLAMHVVPHHRLQSTISISHCTFPIMLKLPIWRMRSRIRHLFPIMLSILIFQPTEADIMVLDRNEKLSDKKSIVPIYK